MRKKAYEDLVDTVLKDAVMALLASESNISFSALVRQLQQHLQETSDNGRRNALRAAIRAIYHYQSNNTHCANPFPLTGFSAQNNLSRH
ncbi:hypothetical protein SAMN05192562_1011175 [Kosakonia arachidis]|uniref:Uncharacterized protein n=1 Tax=Kosakonia arachidis TaxID=551989 RepID=A0A1I6ZHW0_9ENTR|nr:hypothetical protein [Kosakonia arachidis]SFT62286.1 hypothetical protein SAMN05192562_1011175 [Kosakonia arachidis]